MVWNVCIKDFWYAKLFSYKKALIPVYWLQNEKNPCEFTTYKFKRALLKKV